MVTVNSQMVVEWQ